MRVVCGSCDREPPVGSRAGMACAGCGMQLVRVEDEEDLVGKVIDGRFEVVAKLGEGGMGAVYRAKQRSIGRDVAVKVVDRRWERDVAAVKRFMREAKLASELSHPNTVGVVDFGQEADTGRLYLVMELVRGKTLYDVVKAGGALAVDRIARIGLQLVDALEAAHALSIVHRDLKLENVMLLESGRDLVKILDFGLARSFVDDAGRATATGVIAGTPKYLAPEVIEGAQPAPAQDLYALGVMLGELAVGGSLWDAPTFESLLLFKVSGTPKVLDGVDERLRGIVAKLLSPAPAARPKHAEIREALVAIERGGAPAARPARAASSLALEPTGALELVAPAPAKVLPDSAFAPPEVARAPVKIELEEEWQRERGIRFDAVNAKRKASSHFWWILTVLVLTGLGVGGWYYVTHRGAGARPVENSSHPKTTR